MLKLRHICFLQMAVKLSRSHCAVTDGATSSTASLLGAWLWSHTAPVL